MITVKQLREELSKFEDDDQCFAYEGEVTGLIVNRGGYGRQGVIFCSEGEDCERDTRTIGQQASKEWQP